MINWDGWPDTYNQWISASEVEDIHANVENQLNTNEISIEQDEINDNTVDDSREDNEFANNLIPNIQNFKLKKTQVEYVNDENIPSIINRIVSKRKNRRNFENVSRGRKIVKVNIVNDAQTNAIKNLKRK